MDFPDIIYRNDNYLENLHATGKNENKNIIFMQQFYIPKRISFLKYVDTNRHNLKPVLFLRNSLFYYKIMNDSNSHIKPDQFWK